MRNEANDQVTSVDTFLNFSALCRLTCMSEFGKLLKLSRAKHGLQTSVCIIHQGRIVVDISYCNEEETCCR